MPSPFIATSSDHQGCYELFLTRVLIGHFKASFGGETCHLELHRDGPAGVRHSAMEIRMCKGKPYECAEPIKRRQEQLDHQYHWLKGCGLVWGMLVGRGQILKSWHKMPKSLSFVP